MEIVSKINDAVFSVVGGVPLITLLLVTGIFMTVRLKGLQFTKLGYVFKSIFSGLFGKKERVAGAVSPFQALCTALGSTVGTGSIAGVAGAIAIGGPGAVFWMWITAFIGMATKYSEITLAIRFREKNSKGIYVGGPMYYIRNGLGKKWVWLAWVFSISAIIASFGTGNMVQINTMVCSLDSLIVSFAPSAAGHTDAINLAAGIVVAVLSAIVLIGGVQRIGAVAEKMIPVMSIVYIVGMLGVILSNAGNIGPAFAMIFKGAFNPSSIGGGLAGTGILVAMRTGVSKGIFSNEAGLGSAPMAHASAGTKHGPKQGLYGIFEVFTATIVICTLTALTILTSGVPIGYGKAAGAELTSAAFASVFGQKASSVFMFLAVSMFALSSILGWSLYGKRSVEFILGTKSTVYYNLLYVIMIVVGAVTSMEFVWSFSETFNCIMAIPNLIAVLALSGTVTFLTAGYFGKIAKDLKKK